MNRYPISYSDRIYIRAMQHGRTVLELEVANVADITSLIGEIRHAGRRLSGLSRIFIRNHSRGWAVERPFKFYCGVPSPRAATALAAVRAASAAYTQRVTPEGRYIAPRATTKRTSTHTIFPWETH